MVIPMRKWMILLLLLFSCSSTGEKPPWQLIQGRDDGDLQRTEIYRVRVPSSWTRLDPDALQSIADTRLPLCTFQVDDITIVIHNFPYRSLEERIPPQAQISRWIRQFQPLDPLPVHQTPQSHGGFAGMYLECSGTLKGEHRGLMAWAMSLDPEHFRNLERHIANSEKEKVIRQIRGDYTIKITGPLQQLREKREDLHQFARSFELFHPLPHRP